MQNDNNEISQIYYSILNLGMASNVLHVGAHPDDEDVGLIAYLGAKYFVKAGYWSATRGEGGQNIINDFKGDALGIIRTWESLSACSVHRGISFFGSMYDYGFAKTADDALDKWGKDNVVRDIVRAIRYFQPSIVIARWTGTPEDGHGHHQAIGKATVEAFDKAGNPEEFPELEEEDLYAWQLLKLYCSLNNCQGVFTASAPLNLFGKKNDDLEGKEGVIRIDTELYDEIGCEQYQAKAWRAYNEHRSQGMIISRRPDNFFYYFLLLKSLVKTDTKEQTFFDGFDPTLYGLVEQLGIEDEHFCNLLKEIHKKFQLAGKDLHPRKLSKIGENLIRVLGLLRELQGSLETLNIPKHHQKSLHWHFENKILDCQMVITKCLGLEFESLSKAEKAIPTQDIPVTNIFRNKTNYPIKSIKIIPVLPNDWNCNETTKGLKLNEIIPNPEAFITLEVDVSIPEGAQLTVPYWLSKPRTPTLYQWPKGKHMGSVKGDQSPTFRCEVEFQKSSSKIEIDAPIVFNKDTSVGVVKAPVKIVPPLSIYPKKRKITLSAKENEQRIELEVVIRNHFNQLISGNLKIILPKDWVADPLEVDFAPTIEDEIIKQEIIIPAGAKIGQYAINYECIYEERDYGFISSNIYVQDRGWEANLLEPAKVDISLVEVKFLTHLKYAYIVGAEEEVLRTLQSLGLDLYVITDEDLISNMDLSHFDAIIIGSNAYLLRNALKSNYTALLNYVEEGGALIVQYQSYGYAGKGYTPYPFSYHDPHDRVTKADVPVTVLVPESPLFHTPNKITNKEFEGWVHDRGLYFWNTWDKKYIPLLSCADQGEEQKLGGMLISLFGKGSFIYTGYSFFRQLPNGVTGALKLFANLIAYSESAREERITFLKKVELFAGMTREELLKTVKLLSVRQLDANSFICRKGDKGDRLYIIKRGEVKIITINESGEEEVMRVAKAGEVLGELSVFGNIPRPFTLKTQTDVALMELSQTDFYQLILEESSLNIRFQTNLDKWVIRMFAENAKDSTDLIKHKFT